MLSLGVSRPSSHQRQDRQPACAFAAQEMFQFGAPPAMDLARAASEAADEFSLEDHPVEDGRGFL